MKIPKWNPFKGTITPHHNKHFPPTMHMLIIKIQQIANFMSRLDRRLSLHWSSALFLRTFQPPVSYYWPPHMRISCEFIFHFETNWPEYVLLSFIIIPRVYILPVVTMLNLNHMLLNIFAILTTFPRVCIPWQRQMQEITRHTLWCSDGSCSIPVLGLLDYNCYKINAKQAFKENFSTIYNLNWFQDFLQKKLTMPWLDMAK